MFEKEILTITNNGENDLTNHPCSFTLDTKALVDSRKTNSDCNSLQFYINNTRIDHWFESGINTTNTKVWVLIPELNADSNVTLKMRYGKSVYANIESPETIFHDFNDFKTDLHNGRFLYYSAERIAPYGTDLGFNAIYDETSHTTYFEFLDKELNNCVFTYNHTTNAISEPVAVTTSSLDGEHGQGAITIDENGYLWVFSGCHNTECKVFRSTNPRDISAWAQKTSIATITYPQPVAISGGVLCIARYNPNDLYQYITTDNGATWSATRLTNTGRITYPYFNKVGTRLLLSVSPTSATYPNPFWGGCGFMYSDNDGTTWKKASGSSYELPATLQTLDMIKNADNYFAPSTTYDSSLGFLLLYRYLTEVHIAQYKDGTWTTHQIDNNCSNVGYDLRVINGTLTVSGFKIVNGVTELFKFESTNLTSWTSTQLTFNSIYTSRGVSQVQNYPSEFLYYLTGDAHESSEIKTVGITLDYIIPQLEQVKTLAGDGSITITNGECYLSAKTKNSHAKLVSTVRCPVGHSLRFKVKTDNGTDASVSNRVGFILDDNNGTQREYYYRNNKTPQQQWITRLNGTGVQSDETISDNTYHVLEIKRNESNVEYYIDDVLKTTHTSNLPLRDLVTVFDLEVTGSGAVNSYLMVLDWFLVYNPVDELDADSIQGSERVIRSNVVNRRQVERSQK